MVFFVSCLCICLGIHLSLSVGEEPLRKFERSNLENSGIILEPRLLLVSGDNQMKGLAACCRDNVMWQEGADFTGLSASLQKNGPRSGPGNYVEVTVNQMINYKVRLVVHP